MADGMGLRVTSTSVVVATIYNWLTLMVLMGLPLSILLGDTLKKWLNMAQNNYPGSISTRREWHPLKILNSVPRHLLQIQTTSPQRHPTLTSALEPILVVSMPGVAESFKSDIQKMTYTPDFNLVNLLHVENVNLTLDHPNSTIDMLEN